MRRIFFALSMIFTAHAVFAQMNVDSLFAVWEDQSQTDSIRSESFNKYIFYGFIFSNPDSAFVLAEQLKTFGQENKYRKAEAMALYDQGLTMHVKGDIDEYLRYLHLSLAIFEEIDSKRGLISIYSAFGSAHYARSDYPEALNYYERALKFFEEEESKAGMSNLLNSIGALYATQGNMIKALHYFNLSLKINEDLNDEIGMGHALSNIGSVNRNQGNYAKAIEYYEKALKIHEKIKNNSGIATALGNIGVIYKEQRNYTKALEYFEKTLTIYKELGNKAGIASSLINIGSNYKEQTNYTEALEYYQNALTIHEELKNKMGISGALFSIGEVYNKLGKHTKAISACKQVIDLSEEIGILDGQKGACQCLYDAYKAIGNEKGALLYLEKMRVVEDSMNSEETALKLQKMEFTIEVLADSIENVEADRLVEEVHQEEVRQKNRTRNILGASGLLLFLLAGGIYSRLQFINKSKAALQIEKDRSENLLLNILPEEVAEELKEKGHSDAQLIDQVTVLFTDFKGFTALSEQVTPKELVADLHTCFSEFDRICEKYGIEKIKTIGDAYMAAGGLPTPNQTHSVDVVKAALEMATVVEKGKAKKMAENLPFFEVRVGVHTGPVVAGIVGIKKFQYDIWGDTVNTASRMESSGAVGRVNISQATYLLLKDNADFTFESRGKIAAKGKGEIEMYFVRSNSN